MGRHSFHRKQGVEEGGIAHETEKSSRDSEEELNEIGSKREEDDLERRKLSRPGVETRI